MLHLVLALLFLLGLGAMLDGFGGFANAISVFQQLEATILIMLGALIMAVIGGATCIDQRLQQLIGLQRSERTGAVGRPDVRASDGADEKEAVCSTSAGHALRPWHAAPRASTELPDLPKG